MKRRSSIVTLVLLGVLSAGSVSTRADEGKMVPLDTALSTTISGQVAAAPTYAAASRTAYVSPAASAFAAPTQPVLYTWWQIVARWFGSNRSFAMQ